MNIFNWFKRSADSAPCRSVVAKAIEIQKERIDYLELGSRRGERAFQFKLNELPSTTPPTAAKC